MSTSFWSRLPDLWTFASRLINGMSAVQHGRETAAEGVRRAAVNVRSGFAYYCGLLLLIGMVGAGFVILPLGLLLVSQGLLRDSVDRELAGGLVLLVVGLFYLVGPLLFIYAMSRHVLGRVQSQAERWADRIEGRR